MSMKRSAKRIKHFLGTGSASGNVDDGAIADIDLTTYAFSVAAKASDDNDGHGMAIRPGEQGTRDASWSTPSIAFKNTGGMTEPYDIEWYYFNL